jgi:copper chaperone NosL
MMANRSRVLILVASLALGLMYVLPVWTIKLEAPQYPEGLGMVIRINTIEGVKKHDLNNINNLNHYIGMQRIVPESIPELRIMPFIAGVLMLTGILTAALARRRILYAWTIVLIAISAVGMADFWKWNYDYGHNLDDENAIIKIPGMSYQPPIIGSRQILNFTAHSWPGVAGWMAILAAMTAVGVSATEYRRREKDAPASGGEADPPHHPSDDGSLRPLTTVAIIALLSTACSTPEPRPLVAGIDGCADCLMVVDGGGHGAEIVTVTGKIYTFDSAECMVNYLLADGREQVAHSTWVIDFANPDELVDAESAFYLVSPTLGSPMGLGVTAFGRVQDRDGAVHAFGGRPADWSDIQAVVSTAWPDGRPAMKHGGHTATLLPDPPAQPTQPGG